jgi:multidrug efflux pump subunit AcrA (membrane-fusion protein)
MHPNPRRIAPIALALIALAALGYWYFAVRPAQADGALSASGTIEITQVQIAPELGGKVLEVTVEEGSQVSQGQVLLRLDPALLNAQRAQAAAGLEAAKANAAAAGYNLDAARAGQAAAQAGLDLLVAGAAPEQLTAARAQMDQAEAARQAAEAGLAALTAGARAEEVAAARLRLDQARAAYTGLVAALSEGQVDALTTAGDTARDNVAAAEGRLTDLENISSTPASALEAFSAAKEGARTAGQAAQDALAAAEEAGLPFYRQVEAARASYETAALNLSQAQARETLLNGLDEMPQAALDAAGEDVADARQMADDAWTAYNELNTSPQGEQLRAAWNEVQAAMRALNGLGRGAGVETVLNQVDAAAAVSAAAGANLALAENGARAEQVAAAQAQLDAAAARAAQAEAQAAAARAQQDAAQAALDLLDVQIGKLTITAPVDGVVMTLVFQPGEVAAPGALLMVLGQTADKTITVFVPEERYGQLELELGARLSVDSFPGETFGARVVRIADKAEFTPRNVQTIAGRKNTVFAIKLEVDDPTGRLKAGMPADVVFDPQ